MKKSFLINKKILAHIVFFIMAAFCIQPAFSDDHVSVTYFDYILNGGTVSGKVSDVGGAIVKTAVYNSLLQITGTTFTQNYADEQGGVICIYLRVPNTHISDVIMNDNHGRLAGGAISNFGDMYINNTVFSNNTAEYAQDENGNYTIVVEDVQTPLGGGALALGADSLTYITNSSFIKNRDGVYGGAIGTRMGINAKNDDAKIYIDNTEFIQNSARYGGAIFNNFYHNSQNDNDNILIQNTTFENNTASMSGGAIYNNGKDKVNNEASVFVDNVTFKNNTAGNTGGAIHNIGKFTVKDSSFINNKITDIGGKGGAIYSINDITINAVDKNVDFKGNKADLGSNIYMNGSDNENITLKLNAVNSNKSINFGDGDIDGTFYNIDINSAPESSGTVNLNDISNAGNITVNAGTLNINGTASNTAINVVAGQFYIKKEDSLNNTVVSIGENATFNAMDNMTNAYGDSFILADGAGVKADVNILRTTSDNFENTNQNGKIVLTDLQLVDMDKIVNSGDSNKSIDLKQLLGFDDLEISDDLQNKEFKTITPVRTMKASVDENGIVNLYPGSNNRNNWQNYNPSILAGSVAAQMGGYITQLNSYNEAFMNMDMFMLLPYEQRQAMLNRNKYASSNGLSKYDSSNYAEHAGLWFRPYAAFEKVNLRNGPKVENQAYGAFFGGDSKLCELGHGWNGMYNVYIGYNGSHQHYIGQNIYQNGGTLGLTGMAYKGNFFLSSTVNVGASTGEANTAFGHDNFVMLTTGVAARTGYNWELLNGKFIIQPNYQMSYSFINTFDYTTASGVRINTKPLNAIQIEPGLKLIANLENGWQPYAGVSMIWNILDKTNFYANDIALPEMSIKPYVRYGLGLRKMWEDKFTGFGQVYITNGGRNGIGLMFGFRWLI